MTLPTAPSSGLSWLARLRRGLAPALTGLPLILPLALSGCGIADWLGAADAPPLPGQRISVLQHSQTLEADPALASQSVMLPAPQKRTGWPQAGGGAEHSPGHPGLAETAAGGALKEVWRAGIGGSSLRPLSGPVVAEGRIYAFASDSTVHALDEATGRSLWETDLTPESEDGDVLGGGVAFADGKLFATTGYAEMAALDPVSGAILWRSRVAGPLRAAPVAAAGRVYAVTVDNQMVALNAEDGKTAWEHAGLEEVAGILGAASPAVGAGVAVAPYSSGEIFALRTENGRPAWADSLASARRTDPLSTLADISGLPVIDRDQVFVTSHGGRTAAYDLRTGARLWESDIGGTQTPLPVGEVVFLVTGDAELVALTRREGRIRWVAPLERYRRPEKRTDPVIWAGPVLAGGLLWLCNNQAQLVAASAEDGRVQATLTLPDAATLPPVVVNNTLLVQTHGGSIVAYR